MSFEEEVNELSTYVAAIWRKVKEKTPGIVYKEYNLCNLVNAIDNISGGKTIIQIPEIYENSYCFDKGLIKSEGSTFNKIWNDSIMKKVLTNVNLKDIIYLDNNFDFYSYSNLSSVELNGVIATDVNALFRNCPLISKVQLNGLSVCGSRLFSETYADKSYIENINLPKLEIAGSGMFVNQSRLTSINLDSIQHIGCTSFNGCKSLTTLNLPNLKCLPAQLEAKVNYSSYKHTVTVTINKIKNIIKASEFTGCNRLKRIYMPKIISFETNSTSGSFQDSKELEYIDVSSESLSSFPAITIQGHTDTHLSVNFQGTIKNITDETTAKSVSKKLSNLKIGNIRISGGKSSNIITTYIICGDAQTANFLMTTDAKGNYPNLKLISSSWASSAKNGYIKFIG